MSIPHIVQTEQTFLQIPILVLYIRYMLQVVMNLPMQTTRQCRTKTVVRCQKKRLACCVLDDGTCANLLSFIVVAVRWLVVVDANVTASRPRSCVIGNPGRQGRWSPLTRVIQAYLHPSPVLRCKGNKMHSCSSTLPRTCASLRLLAMHPITCSLQHLG